MCCSLFTFVWSIVAFNIFLQKRVRAKCNFPRPLNAWNCVLTQYIAYVSTMGFWPLEICGCQGFLKNSSQNVYDIAWDGVSANGVNGALCSPPWYKSMQNLRCSRNSKGMAIIKRVGVFQVQTIYRPTAAYILRKLVRCKNDISISNQFWNSGKIQWRHLVPIYTTFLFWSNVSPPRDGMAYIATVYRATSMLIVDDINGNQCTIYSNTCRAIIKYYIGLSGIILK